MIEKVLREAVRDIDAQFDVHKDYVLTGEAKTFEDYRFSCGKMEGLTRARAVLHDLLKQLESLDE